MSVSSPAAPLAVRGRRLGVRAVLVVSALLGGFVGEVPDGQARHHYSQTSAPAATEDKNTAAAKSHAATKDQKDRKDQKDNQATTALVVQGKAALAAKEYAAAQSAFTAAYKQAPSPELLFQLGILASAEHRTVAARDLLRRYLQETTSDPKSLDQKEAQRIVELDPGPSGEINVLGARGALVFVDDKLVGALPLPLPLLVPLGTHKVTIELGPQRVEEQLKILSGQVAQMRVNQRTGIVVVSLPQAIIVLPEGSGAPALDKLVTQALRDAAAKERSAVVTRAQAVAQAPALAGCLDKLSRQYGS